MAGPALKLWASLSPPVSARIRNQPLPVALACSFPIGTHARHLSVVPDESFRSLAAMNSPPLTLTLDCFVDDTTHASIASCFLQSRPRRPEWGGEDEAWAISCFHLLLTVVSARGKGESERDVRGIGIGEDHDAPSAKEDQGQARDKLFGWIVLKFFYRNLRESFRSLSELGY